MQASRTNLVLTGSPDEPMSREEHRCPRPCPARSPPRPLPGHHPGRRAQPDPRAGGPPAPRDRPAAHPADETWDAARTPWIVNVAQHPMAVLEVRDTDDVAAAVRWAVEHGVQVTAQPTGHGAGDAFDQVLMLRTRGLGSVAVDVQRRRRGSAQASRTASCSPSSTAPA